MEKLRSSLIKIVLLVVAVQILNLSVYGKSFQLADIKGSITNESNQIDSMIEYLTEVILEYKNAFPESGSHNNHQSHTGHQLKHESIKVFPVRKTAVVKPLCAAVTIPVPSKEDYKYLYMQEINPPPPKA